MSGGTWWLPSPNDEGSLVFNAHDGDGCRGRGCALHGASDHWARDMPLRWIYPEKVQPGARRAGTMMRDCPHGILHYDPDGMTFSDRVGQGVQPFARGHAAACDCPCRCPENPPRS